MTEDKNLPVLCTLKSHNSHKSHNNLWLWQLVLCVALFFLGVELPLAIWHPVPPAFAEHSQQTVGLGAVCGEVLVSGAGRRHFYPHMHIYVNGTPDWLNRALAAPPHPHANSIG